MAFFTFCINCGKKILIKGPGNKLKHFNGKIIQCSKCGFNFIVSEGTLKHNLLELTLNELVKFNFIPTIVDLLKKQKEKTHLNYIEQRITNDFFYAKKENNIKK